MRVWTSGHRTTYIHRTDSGRWELVLRSDYGEIKRDIVWRGLSRPIVSRMARDFLAQRTP